MAGPPTTWESSQIKSLRQVGIKPTRSKSPYDSTKVVEGLWQRPPGCRADSDIPACTDRGRDNRSSTTYRDCKNRAVHRYSRHNPTVPNSGCKCSLHDSTDRSDHVRRHCAFRTGSSNLANTGDRHRHKTGHRRRPRWHHAHHLLRLGQQRSSADQSPQRWMGHRTYRYRRRDRAISVANHRRRRALPRQLL